MEEEIDSKELSHNLNSLSEGEMVTFTDRAKMSSVKVFEIQWEKEFRVSYIYLDGSKL